MKYLKKFSTHSQYDEYLEDEEKVLPNVSWCVTQDDVHFNHHNWNYDVTYTLDGVTATGQTSAKSGQPYVSNLVGESGKQLLPNTVVVTMDGVDITSSSFDIEDNTVKIANVTGAIEIKGKGAAVNSAYEPLQYIHCITREGKPGINLGFPATEKTKVHTEFKVTGGTKGYLLSHPNFAQGDSFCALYVNSTPRTVFKWNKLSTGAFSPTIPNNQIVSVTIDKGTLTMSWPGQTEVVKTLSNETAFTSDKNMSIFGNTTSVYSGGTIGSVYSFTHWEDDVLMRDFVPVRRISDNAIGLYDIINGTFRQRTGTSIWIAPFVYFSGTVSNCDRTMVSPAKSGNTTYAIIGESWQCIFTPSTDYTFNDSSAVFTVLINGVDETNNVATYDSATDSWTLTLAAHWNNTISITANAVSSAV